MNRKSDAGFAIMASRHARAGWPSFWQSDTARLVKFMKATGNRPGLISEWKEVVREWAERSAGPDAEAVKAWLPAWQVRPYYTAEELAPIFPMLAVVLGWRERPEPQKGAARLANELRMAGLPHFEFAGKLYFVVEQCHRAEEFRNALHG
jgi:hypothetical protein